MKKWLSAYVNLSDWTVFGISIFCLIWLICYRFWFVTDDFFYSFWDNADIAGDITYTIFSSIIAAGIFYLFTVFLQKISKIRYMKKGVVIYIFGIENNINIVVTDIINKKITKTYSKDDFSFNNEIAKQNFTNYLNHLKKNGADIQGYMDSVFEFMDYIFKDILTRYSSILPNEIFEQLSTFCNVTYPTLKSKPIDTDVLFPYFETFCSINVSIKLLKEL